MPILLGDFLTIIGSAFNVIAMFLAFCQLLIILGDASDAFRSNKRTLALGALVDLEWFLFQGSHLQI